MANISYATDERTYVYDNSSNATTTIHPSQAYVYLRVVGILLIMVFSLLINTATIVTIRKYQRTMTTQNRLIVNMCAINLIYSLLVQSGMVYSNIAWGWHLGDTACRLAGFMMYLTQGGSIMALMLIAVHRYCIIVHPFSKTLTLSPGKRTLGILAGSWLFVLVVLVPPLTETWCKFGFYTTDATCNLLKQESMSYILFVALVMIAFPVAAKVYCYGRIFCIVRKQNQKMKAGRKKITVVPMADLKPSENEKTSKGGSPRAFEKNKNGKPVQKPLKLVSTSKVEPPPLAAESKGYSKQSSDNSKRRKREINLTLISSLLVGVYLVCYVPYAVVSMMTLPVGSMIYGVATLVVNLYTVLGPMLYVSGDVKLRTALKVWIKSGSQKRVQAGMSFTR